MHVSSIENAQKCIDRYLGDDFFGDRKRRVVDLGSMNVNGTYRTLFAGFNVDYLGIDLEKGPGVDLVLDDPYRIPLPDGYADVVISGQAFEHCEFFWLAFRELVRILSPTGYLILIAPSSGPIHRFPVDCYRFYPDAFAALAKYADCHAVAIWRDEREPWQDLVGVFSKDPTAVGRKLVRPRFDTQNAEPTDEIPEHNVTSGTVPTRKVLRTIHKFAKPQRYLEIGVYRGASLALAECPTVAIDPSPNAELTLKDNVTLHTMTSDLFFDVEAPAVLQKASLDMVFIDGMHLFEFALRDFMNAERYCHPATILAVDDIFPNHPKQAERQRASRVWTGDVWKLDAFLAKYRPDLKLIRLDTSPTGLLIVLGLNPTERTLWKKYNKIVDEFLRNAPSAPPESVLSRSGAVDPDHPALRELFGAVAAARGRPDAARAVAAAIKNFDASAAPAVRTKQ